jgi:Uma2 family endonuclease
MNIASRPMSAEELLALPGGQRYQLVRGELRAMAPAGHEHGYVAMTLGAHLTTYVREHGLGRVYAAETGFKLAADPDTVLAPDVAFVAAARLENVSGAGYFPGPPDLAAEVISPNDRHAEVEAEVALWLAHGARMVVTVNPETRSATVFRSLEDIRILREDAALEGADVVPGWRLPLSELFNA